MGLITCIINPSWEKQLIRIDSKREEHWVPMNEAVDTLYSLLKENNIQNVWIEGGYADCYELVYKFHNAYPTDDFTFTVN